MNTRIASTDENLRLYGHGKRKSHIRAKEQPQAHHTDTDTEKSKFSCLWQDILRLTWLSDRTRPLHIFLSETLSQFWDGRDLVK
jgi:hypothetical protein